MKKLMVIVGALLFAGSISAESYHGCGRGHYEGGYGGGYYAPRPQVYERVIIERPAPRYYDPYEYRGHHRRCHEEYRGGYYR